MDRDKSKKVRILFSLVFWILIGSAFLPISTWLVKQTTATEGLLHAVIVLLFVSTAIVVRKNFTPCWKFGNASLLHLAISYSFLACAVLWKSSFFIIPAFAFFFTAFAFYVLGQPAYRLIYSLLAAFFIFILLLFSVPHLDWPLRRISGNIAVWLLNFLNPDAQLTLVSTETPKLILSFKERLFEVASECNGLGITGGAILLSTMVAIYRGVQLLDFLIAIPVAILTGIFFNGLRILTIVLLAPLVGNYYLLMHEIVGLLFYIGGLYFLWWLLTGLPSRETGD